RKLSPATNPDSVKDTTTFTVASVGLASKTVDAMQFDLDVFDALIGSYYGLVQSATPTHDTSGFIKITVATKGALTASLKLGSGSFSFKGSFDINGDFQTSIPRSGLAALDVTLHL